MAAIHEPGQHSATIGSNWIVGLKYCSVSSVVSNLVCSFVSGTTFGSLGRQCMRKCNTGKAICWTGNAKCCGRHPTQNSILHFPPHSKPLATIFPVIFASFWFIAMNVTYRHSYMQSSKVSFARRCTTSFIMACSKWPVSPNNTALECIWSFLTCSKEALPVDWWHCQHVAPLLSCKRSTDI